MKEIRVLGVRSDAHITTKNDTAIRFKGVTLDVANIEFVRCKKYEAMLDGKEQIVKTVKRFYI